MADLLTRPATDMRLSPADQVLINAAGVLSCQRLYDRNDADLALDAIREVIGRGNPDHPFMAPLLVEMRLLIDVPALAPGQFAKIERQVQQSALLRLSDALARLMRWRMGQALDALRAKGE
jgi:hypothetical protein